MQYLQITFSFETIEDYQQDLLIADLSDIGFNTFEDTENGFSAYIDQASFEEEAFQAVIQEIDETLSYSYSSQEIAAENWNEEWEKNFEPLIVSNACYVRATFHQPRPEFPFEIIIDPKMAFGTGHHQTTTMMMEYILEADMDGKVVLDMGCGTGILAILAAKKNAAKLTAIDYDEVCYASTIENTLLNNIQGMEILCGGKEVIPAVKYDTILANINRNILLDQIPVYAGVLENGGDIYFSGFYEETDLKMITDACALSGILYNSHKKIDNWVAAHFKKA